MMALMKTIPAPADGHRRSPAVLATIATCAPYRTPRHERSREPIRAQGRWSTSACSNDSLMTLLFRNSVPLLPTGHLLRTVPHGYFGSIGGKGQAMW